MALVLGLCILIWAGGALAGLSKVLRGVLVALLFAAVLSFHFVLPDGHGLRMATGETATPLLILVAVTLVVGGYTAAVRWLKARAKPMTVPQKGTFSEVELERYARHIVLREVGGTGQKALKEARVLVIGAGGLGAPVLQYLGAAGVGTIGIIDDDKVENANLQRQVIHKDSNIGMAKVRSAMQEVQAQNPFVTVLPYERRLNETNAAELFADYDLVLDGCDNFETRYLVNATAHALGIPLISGALTQWEGQLSVFHPASGTPCYQCIFPEAPAASLAPSCAEAGVIGPLPGVLGSMMALEAVKLITGAGTPLKGEMLIYDGLYGESRKITLNPRTDCPTCGGKN